MANEPTPCRWRYRGHRTPTACLVEAIAGVREVGVPLPHAMRHSPTGFEWGYEGSGPADLARSLLAHHLGGCVPHPAVYQQFKRLVIARLKHAAVWEFSSEYVAAVLTAILDELEARCPLCLDSGYAAEAGRRCPCQREPDYCDYCGGPIGPSGCLCDH